MLAGCVVYETIRNFCVEIPVITFSSALPLLIFFSFHCFIQNFIWRLYFHLFPYTWFSLFIHSTSYYNYECLKLQKVSSIGSI